jgi:cyclic beta-1,2-glucan synthetase
VLSGEGDPVRSRTAMEAATSRLVDDELQIVRLFTPAFDKTPKEPGYIKSYPPGVRENGGQYTHAATWFVIALAELGRADEAWHVFRKLNPVEHALDEESAERYRVEPYVVAADIYGSNDKGGRGGWTWYTGSAAWLYRAGLEALLGFHLDGDRLRIEPCIPPSWPGFSINWRRGVSRQATTYQVTVENPDGVCRGIKRLELDGQALDAGYVPLADDGTAHRVRVVLG